MYPVFDNPYTGKWVGLIGSELFRNRIRSLFILCTMHKHDRERIVFLFNLLIWNLMQAGAVQDWKQQLQNFQRRMSWQVNLIVNVMVQRIRLQQESAVQNHCVHILGLQARLKSGSCPHGEAPYDNLRRAALLRKLDRSEKLLGFRFASGCD
ncbi:hypothetical protein D1872_227060 [compost metagenome]